jgi:hypothetical protein
MTDFAVEGGGTVYMVTPQTSNAWAWVNENVDLANTQMLGNAFAVEHRYIEPLMDGALDAGFTATFNGREFTS